MDYPLTSYKPRARLALDLSSKFARHIYHVTVWTDLCPVCCMISVTLVPFFAAWVTPLSHTMPCKKLFHKNRYKYLQNTLVLSVNESVCCYQIIKTQGNILI